MRGELKRPRSNQGEATSALLLWTDMYKGYIRAPVAVRRNTVVPAKATLEYHWESL